MSSEIDYEGLIQLFVVLVAGINLTAVSEVSYKNIEVLGSSVGGDPYLSTSFFFVIFTGTVVISRIIKSIETSE